MCSMCALPYVPGVSLCNGISAQFFAYLTSEVRKTTSGHIQYISSKRQYANATYYQLSANQARKIASVSTYSTSLVFHCSYEVRYPHHQP